MDYQQSMNECMFFLQIVLNTAYKYCQAVRCLLPTCLSALPVHILPCCVCVCVCVCVRVPVCVFIYYHVECVCGVIVSVM